MIADLRCPAGHPARSSQLVEPVTTIDPETGRRRTRSRVVGVRGECLTCGAVQVVRFPPGLPGRVVEDVRTEYRGGACRRKGVRQ